MALMQIPYCLYCQSEVMMAIKRYADKVSILDLEDPDYLLLRILGEELPEEDVFICMTLIKPVAGVDTLVLGWKIIAPPDNF
jgi:hypothetical protein